MTASPHKVLISAGLLFAIHLLSGTFGPYPLNCCFLYAQDAEIYIENTGSYRGDSRPAVYFSHENHMGLHECLDCHHDYKDGKNILNEDDLDEDGSAECARCHSEGTTIELKKAYHRQCMGCHRRINKKEAVALPITCGDCHKRR